MPVDLLFPIYCVVAEASNDIMADITIPNKLIKGQDLASTAHI
jgi:hypothetical protein